MRKLIKVLLCTIIGYVGYAQNTTEIKKDSTKIIKLQEVIVTGNITTDPVLSKVVLQHEKNIVQPKNVADLFHNLNGFSVVKRGNYAIDPSFRAAQYEQLNVQYDGGTKAMHACPNRMDPITTHIIPEDIKRIEIIKGPFSVRHGATFGGIINFVTKDQHLEKGLSGKVSNGDESNGNALTLMGNLNYASKRFDMIGSIGYRDFGNYEDANGTEIPSAFRSTDYGIKAGYNFADNERLQVHWRQSFGRDVLHAGLPMDTEYDNSSIISADYNIKNYEKTLKGISAKVYYSYVDHLMTNTDRQSFMMTEASSAVDATTLGGKLELEIQPKENLTLFTGLDALYIERDGSRNRLVKRTMQGDILPTPMEFTDKIWQDSYINDLGVFTEVKYNFNKKTLLTAGVRYDYLIANSNDPEADFLELYPNLEQRTEHNISGTLSLKKKLNSNSLLEIAYGRGVRSANMIERFINHFTVGQDSYEYIGNPFLKSEVNNQFEVGFKGNKTLTSGFDNFSYEVSSYYSIFENYITPIIDESLTRKYMPRAQPQHPKVFRNLENAYKAGFEAMAKIDFLKAYYFQASASYVYTRNEDLNESLPLNPPFSSMLKLALEKENYWANVQFNITSKQTNISPSFGETETAGYETMDIRVGAKPFRNATIGAGILNLFNEQYSNHLNFAFVNQADFSRVAITEPGRNFSVFLQYVF